MKRKLTQPLLLKTITKGLSFSLMFAATLLCTVACDDDSKEIGPSPVTGITIDNAVDGVIKVPVGQTFQVQVTLSSKGNDAYQNRIQYGTSDTVIFKVDDTGVISGLYGGEATLTVMPSSGSIELAQSCKVIVEQKVTDLIVPEVFSVGERGSLNLVNSIIFQPVNATYHTLTYKVADESIVTVDADGNVSGLKQGNTIITVTTTDGSNITKDVNVSVIPYVDVTNLKTLGDITYQVMDVNTTFNLDSIMVVEPANASDKKLTYTIESGEDVISITDKGIVTMLKPGSAEVKVSTSNPEVSLKFLLCNITWLGRTGWSVDTSIKYGNGQNYVTDGTTGKPNDILDGDAATFLSLVKPGKSYDTGGSTYATPAGYDLHFTVDMKGEQTFGALEWTHRAGNSNNYLRVWGISVEGSNDNVTYTPIQSDIALPYKDNNSPKIVMLSKVVKYRYLRVHLTDWSDLHGTKSGSSMQIADVRVGSR
ncbi:MAG: Ig-like domain-containing protein [Mediterranea sp.]|jgi:uncharacterized protein YjdB|nr:Ig-like domain-containing protein [Mediterranea sp.]